MKPFMNPLLTLNVLLGLWPVLCPASLVCRPEGPVLPRPSSLQASSVFKDAAANLSETLTAALDGTIKAGFPTQNLSFSVAIVSIDQPDPGTPLWEYHHLSSANTRGTRRLDRHSQYLIGSITKVLSDYVLMKSGVDLDTPITSYIPELAKNASRIHWQDVTLRMLASHLAGAPTNYAFSEHYYLKDVFQSYGFPPIDDSAYPPCGVSGLNSACTAQEFLAGMANSYPYAAPMERPAYSNIAFTILTLALERVTGKSYTQLIKEFVTEPLGMKNTFPSPGNDSQAIIPPGDSNWGTDYGIDTPAGGLVSSISDLSKFTHALLSSRLNLTATETRGWLKPAAFAGNLQTAVGMPWEIWRPDTLTPKHPHHVTVYGKGGGALLYRSQLSVVDEYGIAVIVLTAGEMNAAAYLPNAVLSTILPAVDDASREMAKTKYARRFHTSSSTKSPVPVEATLVLDDDSLLLSSIQRNGSDVLTAMTDLWSLIMTNFASPIGSTVRLFPQELDEQVTLDGKPATREIWRLWPQALPQPDSDLPGYGIDATNCMSWTLGDWVHYGGEPIDRAVFYRHGGDVVGFELPFLRSGIMRPL
ncbi:beta-lactamase/transpeptidase-like protein [Stachybotrys elegans]|uniref:Beta-lactamase/transpeptidase-like protein n=1 Tax=Stachybotrys elegans TaxID=80388 RepID=A0A8K0SI09_9HYPO|nr:beta-lactamase/transpeptidase-like protein [Stachybotrys elegans]